MHLLPDGRAHLWKDLEGADSSAKEETQSPGGRRKAMLTVNYVKVLPTGNFPCKFKTSKLEAETMAGVVGPPRRPYSRSLGEPATPSSPPEQRGRQRGRKSTEKQPGPPKAGEAESKACYIKRCQAARPSPTCWPLGSHPTTSSARMTTAPLPRRGPLTR